MSQITYSTLKIKGMPISHIKHLEITQKINEHARATIWGEAPVEEARKFLQQATEKMAIRIEHENQTLFLGIFEDLSIKYESDYAIMCAKLISTTQALDCNKQNRSYQNTTFTYQDIMNQSTCGQGDVTFFVPNESISRMIIQYQETSWEFIKRMAADCGTFIVPDITSLKTHVYVGARSGIRLFFDILRKRQQSIQGDTHQFVQAGLMICGQIVGEVKSVLVAGVLKTTFKAYDENTITQMIEQVKASTKPSYAGRIFAGTVKDVIKDYVKVHLTTIDEQFDSGGDWTMPYSTLYSTSKNQAGIYVMPKTEDPVRVFFPTDDPKDAFVASSMTVRGNLDNKLEKCFRTQTGMEVHFSEEGLFISCKNKNVVINLNKKTGVEIRANTPISMYSAKNFGIMAYENLKIQSNEGIHVGTKGSYMSITKDNITAMAPKIFVE